MSYCTHSCVNGPLCCNKLSRRLVQWKTTGWSILLHVLHDNHRCIFMTLDTFKGKKLLILHQILNFLAMCVPLYRIITASWVTYDWLLRIKMKKVKFIKRLMYLFHYSKYSALFSCFHVFINTMMMSYLLNNVSWPCQSLIYDAADHIGYHNFASCDRESQMVDFPNHWCRSLSHDVLLLPTFLFPMIFPLHDGL